MHIPGYLFAVALCGWMHITDEKTVERYICMGVILSAACSVSSIIPSGLDLSQGPVYSLWRVSIFCSIVVRKTLAYVLCSSSPGWLLLRIRTYQAAFYDAPWRVLTDPSNSYCNFLLETSPSPESPNYISIYYIYRCIQREDPESNFTV
jgi:hypothetical protein